MIRPSENDSYEKAFIEPETVLAFIEMLALMNITAGFAAGPPLARAGANAQAPRGERAAGLCNDAWLPKTAAHGSVPDRSWEETGFDGHLQKLTQPEADAPRIEHMVLDNATFEEVASAHYESLYRFAFSLVQREAEELAVARRSAIAPDEHFLGDDPRGGIAFADDVAAAEKE